MKRLWLTVFIVACVRTAGAGELVGYSFLVTSVRTSDTEIFQVDPDTGDARNVTRSPLSEDRYPCWSPDGKWISFRFTDEMYWRDKRRMEQVYAQHPGDKRPVWVIRPDGSDAHVVEPLRYQCAMDGSRAAWKPLAVPARAAAPATAHTKEHT